MQEIIDPRLKQINEYHQKEKQKIFSPTPQQIFAISLIGSGIQSLTHPISRKLSHIFAETLMETPIVLRAAGEQQYEQLQKNVSEYTAKILGKTKETGVQNLLQYIVNKRGSKFGEQIGRFITHLDQSDTFHKYFQPAQLSSFMIQSKIVQPMMPINARSLFGYQQLGYQLNTGISGSREQFQRRYSDQYLNMASKSSKAFIGFTVGLHYYGSQINNAVKSLQNYAKYIYTQNKQYKQIAGELFRKSLPALNPITAMFNIAQRTRYQQGHQHETMQNFLQNVVQFKETLERQPHIQKRIGNIRTESRVARNRYLERGWYNLIEHLEKGDSIEARQFVEEMIQKTKKTRTSRLAEIAGQRPITFKDIIEGSINPSDFIKRKGFSKEIEQPELFNDRIRKLLRILVDKYNMPIETAIGEGLYVKNNKLISIIPARKQILEQLKTASYEFKIPFLGFSPFSLMLPRFFSQISEAPIVSSMQQKEIVPSKLGAATVEEVQRVSMANKYIPQNKIIDVIKKNKIPSNQQLVDKQIELYEKTGSLPYKTKRRLVERFGLTQYQQLFESIENRAKNQTLITIGNKPFISIGETQELIDVSDIVPKGYILPQNQLTRQLKQVYGQHIGSVVLKEQMKTQSGEVTKQIVSKGQKRNLPFFTDFQYTSTTLEEIGSNLKRPFEFRKQMSTFIEKITAGSNDYMDWETGRLFSYKRLYSHQIGSIFDQIKEEIPVDTYNEMLIDIFKSGYKINEGLRRELGVVAKKYGETSQQYKEVKKLLDLLTFSPAEKRLANEIIQQESAGKTALSALNLEEQISQQGSTRKEILEKYATWYIYMFNRADELYEETLQKSGINENALIEFFGKTRSKKHYLLEARQSYQRVLNNLFIQRADKDIKQTKRFIERSMPEFVNKDISKMFSALYVKNIFGGFDIKNMPPNIQNAYDVQVSRQDNILKSIKRRVNRQFIEKEVVDIFGSNYIQNKLKNITSEVQMLNDIVEFGDEYADEEVFFPLISGKPILKDRPYVNLVDYNKNIYIPEFQVSEEKGLEALSGLIRKLFPRLQPKDFSQTYNTNIVSLLLHYSVQRTSNLLDQLGIGRPNLQQQTNAINELSGVLRKVSFIAAGVSQFFAIDQLLSTATNNVLSPKQQLVSLAQNVSTGAVSVQNAIGLGPMQRSLHNTMPGLLQSVGAVYGWLSGDMTEIFTMQQLGQMAEHIPTTREYQLQMEGIKNVPVFSQRGWEFGREPYWGGQVKEYRPHLLYLEKKEWQYTPLQFGSKIERLFFDDTYRTPFNLFGILPQITQYYDRKLLLYRPYAQTGQSQTQNNQQFYLIPNLKDDQLWFLGSSMLGSIMPSFNLIDNYLNELQKAGIQQYLTQDVSGQYLGATQARVTPYVNEQIVVDQNRTQNLQHIQQAGDRMYQDVLKTYELHRYRMQDTFTWFYDYLGFIGFSISLIGRTESITPKLQTSGYWRSRERMFYQQRLGGLLGYTEFYRRLNQSNMWKELAVNPMPNVYMMLNFPWLPERFQYGDPYQQIPYGEVRIPGPGYEKIFGLIDNYGPLDIFRILQNVQPKSSQYEQQKKVVDKMMPDIQDERIRYLITSQREEAEIVRKGPPTRERQFTMKMQTVSQKVREYLGDGMLLLEDGTKVRLHGFTTDVDEIAKRIFETKNVSIEEAYELARREQQQIEEQLEQFEGSTMQIRIPKDVGLMYSYEGKELVVNAITDQIEQPKEARRYENQFDLRYNYGSNFVLRAWERFQHMHGMFHEKFIPVRSQAEEYLRYNAYGQYRQLWQKPISDIIYPQLMNTIQLPFAESVLHQTITGQMFGTNIYSRQFSQAVGQMIGGLGNLLVPHEAININESRRRHIEEEKIQLDELQGRRTILDMKNLSSLEYMGKRLPYRERRYLESLANAPQEDWGRILEAQPSYMKPILSEIYQAKREYAETGQYELSIDQNNPYMQELMYRIQQAGAEIPEIVQENQNLIDSEKYRTLRFLEEFKTINLQDVYHTQIVQALNGIYRTQESMNYDFTDTQMYKISKIQKMRTISNLNGMEVRYGYSNTGYDQINVV